MSDEAAWKLEKIKYEEPGYVIVRKSKGVGDLRNTLKAGLDGVAGEWIKLNKSDLGSGGAGGSYDDTALWKEIADLNDTIDNLDIPDISDLATKDQLSTLQNQVTKDIADLKDHLDNHPSGGGDTTQIEEDIAKLKDSVSDLETALGTVEDELAQEIKDRQEADKNLQDQIDSINASGYDDTELVKRLEEDEKEIADHEKRLDSLDNKSDADHTHDDYLTADDLPDPYDDTAVKDAIRRNGELIHDLKNESRKGDADLNKKVDEHTHDDFADKDEFDALKATVEEHLTNHPEGGGAGGVETFEFRWEHDDANSTPATGKGYWSNSETAFHFSKTDADGNPFSISTGSQDIVVKTGDATSNITEVLQVYDLGTGWVASINYTGDRPVFGEDILWGMKEEPETSYPEENYDDSELRELISDEETARVEGDKDLQDQIDVINTQGYDDTGVKKLIKDEKDKNDEQDARLDALEAGGASGNVDGVWALASSASSAGKFEGLRNFGQNVTLGINPVDNDGDEKSFASLEAGDIVNVTNQSKSGNGKYEITSISEEMFYWRMGLNFIEGTSDGLLNGNLCNFEFEKVSGSGDDFDATYLEEKDAEQDDRLDQIDLDQEAQNDRLDKIDEDQKTQDARLTALEGGGGNTGEFLAAEWIKGVSTNDGYFSSTGNLNSDIFFSFNRKDASGVGQDLSVVEAGHVFVAESKNTGEWGKWEVTSNGGLESGKYQIGTKSLESSSDNAWENQATYTFTFSDPSKVEEVFDPAELVERLDQIDEDQETQNDRLDQIDLDQEAQNARLDDLETSLGASKKFNFTTIANPAFIGTDGVIHLSTGGSGKQFMKVNKKDASGNDVPQPEVGEPVKLGVDGQVIYFPVAYSSDTGSHWSINSAEDYTDGIKITEDGKDVELTFGEEEPETFDPTYLEEKDSEQDDRLDQIDEDQEAQDARLDALEASAGVSEKFNFTTVSSQSSVYAEGTMYLAINGTGKQFMQVNKKDANGKDVPQPEVGDLVALEVDGQEIYFPVGSTGNNGSNWSINSPDDYTDGIRISEDGKDSALTFGGEEPYRFDPTYLEEKDAEQDERLDKIDTEQETQNIRLDVLEEVAYKPVIGVWRRTDNAGTSGGMIGVSGFNAVSNIFLNFRDMSGEAFDFTGIEVGTPLTITNQNDTNATGKYKVTKIEDKGTNWNIQVDILEGTGVIQKNENAEFSFGIPVEPLDTEKVVTVAEGQEGPLSIWRGTKAEYDAIAAPSDEVLYVVLP